MINWIKINIKKNKTLKYKKIITTAKVLNALITDNISDNISFTQVISTLPRHRLSFLK